MVLNSEGNEILLQCDDWFELRSSIKATEIWTTKHFVLNKLKEESLEFLKTIEDILGWFALAWFDDEQGTKSVYDLW